MVSPHLNSVFVRIHKSTVRRHSTIFFHEHHKNLARELIILSSDNRLKAETTLNNVCVYTAMPVCSWTRAMVIKSFLTQQVKSIQRAGEELEITCTSSLPSFHSKLLLSIFLVFLQVRKTKCKQTLENNKLLGKISHLTAVATEHELNWYEIMLFTSTSFCSLGSPTLRGPQHL